MTKILICICTYYRNIELINCLNSINKTNSEKKFNIKVLILDNSRDKHAFNIYNRYKSILKFKIEYISEKKRGVVIARNKGLNIAKKRNIHYLGFLDDDCEVKKNWFKNLYKLIIQYKPEIITGPQKHKNNLAYIFEKNYVNKLQYIKWASNNNVFISKKILKKENLIFDKKLNYFGIGEDQLFFLSLYHKGYKILWSKKLIVKEISHKHRQGLKWIIQRSFRLGVIGCYIDTQIKGKVQGLLLNYIKSIYYFLLSIFVSFQLTRKYFYFYSVSYFFKCLGRIISFLIFQRKVYYKK